MIKQSIQCECTHRKLAMIDKDALHIMCRSCKTEQRILRQELIQKWLDLDRVEEENRQAVQQICENYV